ncbi:acyl-[acyl-carrier-protein] thioesterase [Clostridium beijerinckii]|jgi:Acyl-ACP thioesterase|uniref:Acyl-ACP thioesterase n=2 Tax=Clostridium beijerinckii TaxID=1520 RepID=A0AAE2V194_CLOBE|nr:acyl-ACP thioesterase domain-containing protein [Clostridium beijerinckii]ABR32877.1 acyl-ACP thioesterase [Clostridium beijerinckii NCIMB 8052]AIU01708.1 acyl-ACP thioesterase [Clostridium beijerinckii ATCC 35702]MBF7807446.1 hypothetical protein [Clostridium beijerinckii]NOW88077.1 medium-chain acyl-[acyl-carrier-protein] hydrolase [Clostridium beijerinckii]NRT25883.1 medium-chain acyl-[acyl-carrier-protein] hydrolase [Clostridium beijerinckii]
MLSIDKEYEINYYDIDLNWQLMFTSVMNLFQDTFVHMSENLGRGIRYLNSINLTWMVNKWEINMYEYPTYNEKIKVRMTPIAYRKSLMNIQFEIFNSRGKKVADAFSLWILLDMKQKIPCRNKFEDMFEVYGLKASENKINTMKKINISKNLINTKKLNVGYCDIDTNGHVNNVKYLYWILDTISEDIVKDYKITKLRISYKKSANYSDIITLSFTKNIENKLIVYSHKIADKENSVLVLAETVLQKSYVDK